MRCWVRSLLFLTVVCTAIALSGCGGGILEDTLNIYPYMGSYSGSYTGTEQGSWSALVDDKGHANFMMNSPSMGTMTGAGDIAANGSITVVASGSGAGPTVTWHGSFVKTTRVVYSGGDWTASNGLQGCFAAGNHSTDLKVTAEQFDQNTEYQLPIQASPGIRTKWDKSALSGLNIQEFHVWRSGVATPVMTAQATQTTIFDDGLQKTLGYISTNSQMRTTSIKSSNVPAIEYGKTYRYSVTALCSQKVDGVLRFMETPLSTSGQVTALSPIEVANLKTPAVGSHPGLQTVNFKWISVKGADTYVLEASSNPSFASPEYISSPITVASTAAGQTISLNVTTLSTLFSSLASNHNIFWRVGEKCSTDNPGPVAPSARPTSHYIYSEDAYFSK